MLRRWSLRFFVLLGLACWPAVAFSDIIDPNVIIQRMAGAYNGIHDYTALFLKRERIKGTMQPLEKIELRFQEPFKVYMAWHEPNEGRIITYIEGENNNKILVSPGGMLRFMRMSLDPTGSMAMRGVHHSVLQAGLRNTIDMLMRQYERGVQRNEIDLHFRGYGEVDGRPAYHLEFICRADDRDGYYAYRGEIWVDKEYYLPTRLYIYDWDNQLYEHYEYHRLRLNPGLGPEAFTISPAEEAQPSTTEIERDSDS